MWPLGITRYVAGMLVVALVAGAGYVQHRLTETARLEEQLTSALAALEFVEAQRKRLEEVEDQRQQELDEIDRIHNEMAREWEDERKRLEVVGNQCVNAPVPESLRVQ